MNKNFINITIATFIFFLSNQANNILAMHSLHDLSFYRTIKMICDLKLDEEIPPSLSHSGLDDFLSINRPYYSTSLQSFLPIFNKTIKAHYLAKEEFPKNFDPSDKIYGIIQLKKGPLRNHLVSTCHKNSIKIWNPFTKECINILEGHTNAVTSVIEINYNGIWCVASASQDETVRIWDLSTCTCLRILKIKNAHKIIQLKNGHLISVGDVIKIWDLTTEQCVATLDEHTEAISSVIELDTANLIATSSYDDSIKIWDLDQYTCMQTLNDKTPLIRHWFFSVIQLKDGNITAASSDKSIKIWDPFTGECIQRLKGHNAMVISIIQLANGDLVSGDSDGFIKIWHESETKEYECSKTLKSKASGIQALLQMHDGNLVSGSWDRSINIWNLYPYDTQNLSLKQYRLISSLDKCFSDERVELHPDWLEVFQSLPEFYQTMFNKTIQISKEDFFHFGSKRKERHNDDDFPFPENKKFEQS